MHYSQGFLDDFTRGLPHLIVSLDGPASHSEAGQEVLAGVPRPARLGPLPATVQHLVWARRVAGRLERFRPTHLLVRSGGLMAERLLRLARRCRWKTLAVFAGYFPRRRLYDRLVTGDTVRSLNSPAVYAAGNHRRPATESMVEAGVSPAKAVAWDFPAARRPADYPAKTLDPAAPVEIVYVGSMVRSKGVDDIIKAALVLRGRGRTVFLTLYGDGPDRPAFEALAAGLPAGTVRFLGVAGNDETFAAMRRATFVAVPSRHSFTEGFAMALTEALAARTPVLASDHPVFVRGLPDGGGLRYYPSGDAGRLAGLVGDLLADPAAYARLSERTAAAFDAVQCPLAFHELIEDWAKATF